MVTEGPFGCTINNQQTSCWKVKSKDGLVRTQKVTDGAVTFTPLEGGGSVSAVVNLGNGKYQASYTTGAVPLKNVIEAWAEATITVPEVRYDPDTKGYVALSEVPAEKQATLRSGQLVNFDKNTGVQQTAYYFKDLTNGGYMWYISDYYDRINYTAYGVDVKLSVEPLLIQLDEEGRTLTDTVFKYHILPDGSSNPSDPTAAYRADIADIDILATDQNNKEVRYWYLVGDSTIAQGETGFVVGSFFD